MAVPIDKIQVATGFEMTRIRSHQLNRNVYDEILAVTVKKRTL
jgi:hypothetical protein